MYSWKLLLANEGVITWFFNALGLGGVLRAVQAAIEVLAAERPDDAVLSEEGADDPIRLSSPRVWIVDPLGHLMMRFPDAQQPEAVRDDIRTLLKNSRIG